MARPRKPKATATPEATTNGFLEALRFLSLVTKEKGPINETHVYLNNKQASAFNGVIGAGHNIQEDIFAGPNNKLLIDALSKCGEHLSITQLDNNRISIKSDKFKAIIPCIDPTLLGQTIPDQPCAIIDDRLKQALEAVGVLASEDAQSVVAASILLNNGSAIATNRSVIFEYWHGIDLPPMLVLPKAIVNPIVKSSKKLAKFGFSHSSATFYYEDESWIRSQFYSEPWPDIAHILNIPSNPFPVPDGFFKALEAIAPFSPDGYVHFRNGLILSHPEPTEGASYEVPGVPPGPCYSIKYLMMIKPYAERIDFIANNCTMLVFYGPNIRGAMMGKEVNHSS